MKNFNDIDILRSEWRKLSNSNLKKYRTTEEIEVITRQKSKNEINKIKRKFIIENAIGYPLLLGVCIFINLWSAPREAIIFNILMGVMMLIIFILMIPLLKMRKIDDMPIALYLTNTVSLLKRMDHLVQLISIIFIPVCFLCGVATGVMHGVDEDFSVIMDKIIHSKLALTTLIGSLVLMSVSGFFMVKYYYKKMYGKHITNLEKILDELNQSGVEEGVVN